MSDHDEILVALRRITRAIDLQSKRLVKATGLTAPQLVVIDTLHKQGDMSPSAIARAVSLSQATITSILDRLVQAGLVERVKSDTDKRVVMAKLTAKGIEASKSSPELLQAGFLRSFRTLQPWEQNMLIASLQRIAELMDAEALDAAPFLEPGELHQ
ncbi:MAG: MarR family transcriptional regulator [Alphaproteobacteria bacterium]|uniref:MarR family winged helix-turn-helix transcriptional regulator n=1 Tax=Maricaulis alexandrii TaxID=2570354 RepID=UPI001109AC8F|nr:MarR family transcriptional regulator [Maricaulis alexandrii]MCR9267003.1 MarR family transcriptional regulator [Alphaproteobacteria bacterium]